MTRHPLHTLLPLTAALLIAACSGGSGTTPAVPKPQAWPRVEVYPQQYAPLQGAPAHIEVNTAATVMPDTLGRPWFTLRYPRYNATVYLTFTPVTDATRATVVDNRVERMALNTGGIAQEVTEFTTAGGYHAQLLEAKSATVTPLQLLAVGPRQVLSGAVFIQQLTNLDSVRPQLDALRADLLHSLKSLR